MRMQELPANAAPANEDGINDALEAAAFDEDSASELADLLEQNPRAAIRRGLRLSAVQRTTLMRMSDAEVRDLVAPVVQALRTDGPNFTVNLTQQRGTGDLRWRVECKVVIES